MMCNKALASFEKEIESIFDCSMGMLAYFKVRSQTKSYKKSGDIDFLVVQANTDFLGVQAYA